MEEMGDAYDPGGETARGTALLIGRVVLLGLYVYVPVPVCLPPF